MSCSLVASEK